MKDVCLTLSPGDHPPKARLIYGVDVREGLRLLPDEHVQSVATSPPYWGLRTYGQTSSTWDDWEGQLGCEPTCEMYVAHLVEVFREVRRVLRDDGTVWLNLGDSYFSGTGDPTLKPKDLVGIPWRVALALQADGWYLRNDIIWHKTSYMPSPVKDRLTCSYEHVFLLAKSPHYYFDLDAIRVPHTYGEYDEDGHFTPAQQWLGGEEDAERKYEQTEGQLGTFAGPSRHFGRGLFNAKGKNPGDTWLLPTQPYKGAHFAVWPPVLVERMVKAGTRKRDTLLDPFSGSGTTGLVALRHSRNYIGIDINESYLEMATARIRDEAPPSQEAAPLSEVLELFGGGDDA